MPKNKFLAFQRSCYAMAQITQTESEITMYGDIVETIPKDWWTGEEIPGNYIVQDEFLTDLESLAATGINAITLKMNSLGGDCCVSILIHNRLRELAAKGVKLTCIVDGVAMSGGSLIMCACDKVVVHPASLIMIHKCWSTIWGDYNADNLRQLASDFDAWDKAQVEIYKRKSNKSDTIISHMMSETTTMVGKEAIEKGFADELTDNVDSSVSIAASADRRTIYVKGRTLHLASGMHAPESIPVVTPSTEDVIKTKSSETPTTKKEENPMATNLSELRNENPELASAIENEVRASVSAENKSAATQASAAAASEERKRLEEIDAIASLYDSETVHEAKYGDNPCTAQEMAFRAAMKAAKNGESFMKAAKSDTDESGVNGVKTTQAPEEENEPKTPEEKLAAARSAVKATLNKNKGE